MSLLAVRRALENALNSITPAIDIAWQNVPYTPVSGVPYIAAVLSTGETENPTIGGGHYRLNGMLKLAFCYPKDGGTLDAMSRAELSMQTFSRGASFVNGGIQVNISNTPSIMDGFVSGDYYIQPTTIRWWADVFN